MQVERLRIIIQEVLWFNDYSRFWLSTALFLLEVVFQEVKFLIIPMKMLFWSNVIISLC